MATKITSIDDLKKGDRVRIKMMGREKVFTIRNIDKEKRMVYADFGLIPVFSLIMVGEKL